MRAAAASDPLISAVGHETDVTLSISPPTCGRRRRPRLPRWRCRCAPSCSCALAAWQAARSPAGSAAEARRSELRSAARALPTADELLAATRQRLDHVGARLPRALIANAQIHHREFSRIAARLSPQTLRTQIVRERERVAATARRSGQCLRVLVERRRERYDATALRLNAGRMAYVNVRRTQIARARERILALQERARLAFAALLQNRDARLERAEGLVAAGSDRGVRGRGFTLVRDVDGRPWREAAKGAPGKRLDIEFSDGRVRALAEASSIAPIPPPKRRRRGGGEPGQGSLFE